MVPHLLVDVEVGRGRRVEAGQQLVDHDQQLHLAGSSMNCFLTCLLELLDLVHRRLRRLVELVGQHLPVDVVLAQLLGLRPRRSPRP